MTSDISNSKAITAAFSTILHWEDVINRASHGDNWMFDRVGASVRVWRACANLSYALREREHPCTSLDLQELVSAAASFTITNFSNGNSTNFTDLASALLANLEDIFFSSDNIDTPSVLAPESICLKKHVFTAFWGLMNSFEIDALDLYELMPVYYKTKAYDARFDITLYDKLLDVQPLRSTGNSSSVVT
ncbi:MAG: hypothetical protein V3T17_19320 [Pseudomonadales bacterium]